MIDRSYLRNDVPQLLIGASPSFERSDDWTEFWKDYGDEQEVLHYLLVAAFVRHLINLKLTNNTAEFNAIFELVEEMHILGDSYVRNLATVGILEGLQNMNLHHDGTSPDDFVRFLGPVSKWWWDELYWFWDGKGLLGMSGRPRPPGMPEPTTVKRGSS
jgi:hypothetical protein